MDRILELLSARWLIHEGTALSYLPLAIAFLNGQDISALSNQEEEEKRSKPKAVNFSKNGIIIQASASEYELTDPGIPEDSVAIIPIQGVITPWKSKNIQDSIRVALANDNIISILFPVNSPGGTVTYTDILAAEIKNSPKPTVAASWNMMASAAMWIGSSANYRISTSKLDWIGSIGVMVSLSDYRGLFEKWGIKDIEIYADKSTRKNEFTRALFADPPDQAPIKADLNFTNEIFHETIRTNLGIKADSEVFTGAIFNGVQAMDHGLINEINSLDYAIQYAYKLGMINKAKNQYSKFKTN